MHKAHAFGSKSSASLGTRGKSYRKNARRRHHYFTPTCENLEERTLLAAGDLDPTFGTLIGSSTGPRTGQSIVTLAGHSYATGVALQQGDGKLILSGTLLHGSTASPSGADAILVRLNADGTPDDGSALDSTPGDSFGINGVATLPISGFNNIQFSSLALLPNGAIVAAGNAGNAGSQSSDWIVARFSTSGVLDTMFGVNGIARRNIGTNSYNNLAKVAIQPDGRIVAAGYGGSYGFYDFALMRLNANGSLDDGSPLDSTPGDSFGTAGRVLTNILGNDVCWDLAIQPDGLIVAAGNTGSGQFASNAIAAVRYKTDGTPDTSFGSNGIVTVDTRPGSAVNNAHSIDIQPTGEILIGGSSWSTTSIPDAFTLTRLRNNGSRDDSFGDHGVVVTPINSDFYGIVSLAVQADGYIVALGGTDSRLGGDYQSVLLRYKPDGSPDTLFGTNGQVSTGMGTPFSPIGAILIQPLDQKIVLVGSRRGTSGVNSILVERYTGDPLVTVNAIAYQMASSPFDDTSSAVPHSQNTSPGVGIRINNDDDNANGHVDFLEAPVPEEHDLIRVNLSTSLSLRPENLRYYLTRDSVNLQAWDHPDKSGAPLFGSNASTSAAFDISGISRDIWLEWASANSGTSSIVLQAKADTFLSPLSVSKINFFTSTSIPNARDLGVLVGQRTFNDSFRTGTTNNDYTKFQIVDSSMVNISLESDRQDSDLRLFDSTGTQIIDHSEHSLLEGDSISRILKPGTYYAQVFKQPLDLGDDYTVGLSATPLTSSLILDGIVSREGSGNIDHVRLKRIDNLQIVASSKNIQHVTTWLVIHGRADDPDTPGPGQSAFDHPIGDLAQAIDGFKPGDQVLTLDWRESASDNFPAEFGLQGASWISSVAQWTTHALSAIGIRGEDLNLVGHSWGSFVAYEIANAPETHGVHSLVVLDPAKNIPLLNDYSASNVVFASVADWSWAFEGSFFGSEPLAASAQETFATIVPGRDTLGLIDREAETHSNLIRLFSTIVRDTTKDPNSRVSSHFSLANLLVPKTDQPWTRDALPSHVGYEALIQGQFDGMAWHPKALQYVEGGIGVRESVTPNSVGSYIMHDYVGSTKATARDVTDPIIGPPRSVSSPLIGSRTFENWVGTANPSDYYKFTIDPKCPIFRLKLVDGTPNLRAYLFNSNGSFVFYLLLGVPVQAIAVDGQPISIKLPPGKYYVQLAANDYTDVPYALSFAATLDRPTGVLALSPPVVSTPMGAFTSLGFDLSSPIQEITKRDAERTAARSKTPAKVQANRQRLGRIPDRLPSAAPMAK